MYDFSERVVIITGAAGNLGQAVAYAFASAGARLVLLERSVDHVKEILPDLSDSPTTLPLGADLTDPDSSRGIVDKAIAHFDKIDILVNTVGGYQAGALTHETPVETWDFMMDLNARTVFLTSSAVIPHMLTQEYGKVINVAARPGLKGIARMSAYSASKSAVIRLTETMAAELRHSGINVNCVLPGTIDTPQNRKEMPTADHTRWVPPEDIASVILFLASEASRAINGAAIPVYGRS